MGAYERMCDPERNAFLHFGDQGVGHRAFAATLDEDAIVVDATQMVDPLAQCARQAEVSSVTVCEECVAAVRRSHDALRYRSE